MPTEVGRLLIVCHPLRLVYGRCRSQCEEDSMHQWSYGVVSGLQ